MKKYIITIGMMLACGKVLLAQGTTIPAQELVNRSLGWESQPSLVLSLLILVIILLTLVIWVLGVDIRKKVRHMSEQAARAKGEVPVKRATWMDLFRRLPGSEDRLMKDHEYDSIHEYDNAPPAWFNWLFYLSIVYAAGYMLYYHVFHLGPLQEERYAIQMKDAEVQMAKMQENALKLANEPRYTDAAKIDLGKEIFQKNCIMCHGDKGQGNIGPNLTDDYWLHGGKYSEVFTTIFNGVPEKGMVSWKKSLKPEEIREVASFVYTLRGTNPPNPKAPQGNKYVESASF